MVLAFAPSVLAQPIYTDVARQVGIDFVHDPGMEGKHMAPEVMGSGAAFFDYDNDGDLDVYLVQAGPLPESKKPRPPDRLYRQNPDGKFTDVTAASGLGDTGYGTGVAVGDFDNDGFVDVFVTNYGPNSLYRNQGNGKFVNVTAKAGIGGSHWSASSAFCDYDADGFLDLFVTNYVKFDPAKVCVKGDGAPDYCSPQSLPYETDLLYHNNGNGTFTDVTRPAGITAERLPGLGVVCADFTGDGRIDFYVANDGEANNLWVNQGAGKFEDQAFLMGAAVSAMGRPQASMGIALGDIDADSDLDLFLTHLINDYNTLYVNDGKYGFEDQSAAAGLVAPSLPFTGFGTAFIDYEHDSDLDIVVVNGAVDRHKPYPGREDVRVLEPVRRAQAPLSERRKGEVQGDWQGGGLVFRRRRSEPGARGRGRRPRRRPGPSREQHRRTRAPLPQRREEDGELFAGARLGREAKARCSRSAGGGVRGWKGVRAYRRSRLQLSLGERSARSFRNRWREPGGKHPGSLARWARWGRRALSRSAVEPEHRFEKRAGPKGDAVSLCPNLITSTTAV